jgi:hypothetical protein
MWTSSIKIQFGQSILMKRKIISELKKRLVSTVSSIPFPKIKSPTLQIWGEEDLFLAEGTDEFVDAPLSLKASEEVNQIIEEFLDYKRGSQVKNLCA